MTEAVQEQELEFWDLWKKSQSRPWRLMVRLLPALMVQGKTTKPSHILMLLLRSTPSLHPKEGQHGGRGKGRRDWEKDGGSSQSWHDKSQWQWQSSGGSSGGRIAALEAQVRSLTRLSLRHEGAIGMLRHEFSFVIHAKVDAPTSVAGTMFATQQALRTLKEKEPSKLNSPLRVALLSCLFRELQSRMEQLLQDEPMRQTWIDMEWLSRDAGFFPYLRYNQETKKHEPEKSRPGIPTHVLREHIAEVAKHIPATDALVRFHPIRPLTSKMSGESLVFLVQTGVASEASQSLAMHLRTLIGHSVTQLCAFNLQADRLQRSGLAVQLSKGLQDGGGR